MPKGKKPVETGRLAMDTEELPQGEERAGREVGKASDETVARILLGDEIETGDQTRELDLSAFRTGKSGSS